ncbi:DUF3231 family protein [Mesobacillus jeotgali]|uniref:DUF3231 family protein n=1 Tax=Mesobacillus jeotgali TaxID=129985 RepID=UPI001CFD56CF|nr:DUF3231 family protein [Mesobacillus jeotgali]
MTQHENIQLTSAELAALHQNYLGDTMSVCVLGHFLETVVDQEIKTVVEHALEIALQHVEDIKEIFNKENIPVPIGFTVQDVNKHAPRLFSDPFYLSYIKHMARGGLSIYGFIQPHAFRSDVLSFYSKCLHSAIELNNIATDLLQKKGLADRPAYIPYPEKNEFVQKQSFLSGFMGDKRPLTGMEITHLYANIQTNKLGEALAIGFSQVAQSNKVRKYFLRGKEISEKHINVFSGYLRDENLPVPMTWNHEVSISQEAPFSDKLMMFHFGLMNFSGSGNYGMSVAASQRKDIAAIYTRLNGEILLYAEDGANIMIDEAWLEQPPLAADRNDLAKK